MALQDSGIFIASSLIADTPEKDKENAEPGGDTPAAARTGRRSGEGGARSARKSLLGRRRSSIGRRLSGFGAGGYDANADQGKLTSMYSNIIKLNSENKITRDKCWGLHLIDFMDKVIMDEGGQMGGSKVNFQKASCTLDASVKIYSHRVDATHMMGYSLLENLNRTDNDKPENGSGATPGSSERSTRLGVHETLKKGDQLNQSETDRAFKIDPMFHKMSKIFDEAGSKGMLLNNLSVSDGCKVSFDSSEPAKTAPPSPVFKRPGEAGGGGEENEESSEKDQRGEGGSEGETAEEKDKKEAEAAAAVGGMTDIKELRSTLFSLCRDLSSLPLCPQLQEFRDEIAEVENNPHERPASFGDRGHSGGDDSDSDGGGRGGGFDDVPGSDDGASFDGGGGGFGGGGGDEDGGGVFGVAGGAPDDEDPFEADNGDGFGVGGVSFLDDNDEDKNNGGVVAGNRASSGSGETGVMTPVSLEDRLCVDMKIVNDDYAFYDTGALAAAAATSSNNTWAGASHWKFVGVKKKRPARSSKLGSSGDGGDMNAEDDAEEGGAGRKARGKRKPPAIDFDAPPVAGSKLADPSKPKGRGRSRQDPTLLSEDYVRRALKAAEDESSNYALPENAGFKTKDLGELFLRPGAFTKRWTDRETGGGSEGARHDLQGFHDTNPGGGNDDLLFADANDGYSGGDDFDDGDDDDDGSEGFQFAGGFDADDVATVDAVGGGGAGAEIGVDGVFVDNFEGQGLLSAGRRVEKISVNYARKAKRVDVRRLKGDLWRKIHTEFQSDAGRTPSAAPPIDVHGQENEAVEGGPKVEEDKTKKDGKGEDEESPEDEKKNAEASEPEVEVVDMTFSGIVHDVSSREEQSGVTVPFYFICLLHLANEKGLKLEGRQDLLDFSVASDPVKEGSH
eukprot:g19447.t2